jgi:hypothetical protein
MPAILTMTLSTWYYVFAISKSSGTTDFIVDDNLTCARALAPGTAPVTAGYTLYRRIGEIYVDSSVHIDTFKMDQIGSSFKTSWKTPKLDLSQNNPGTSAVLWTARVPPLLRTTAILSIILKGLHPNVSARISDPLTDDLDPATYENITKQASTASACPNIHVETSATGQIRYRFATSSATLDVIIITEGWIE